MPLDMTSTDSYDTPDSTPDPYATSSSSATSTTNYGLPPYIDLSSLPSGLLILGPLTGYTTGAKAGTIRNLHARMSKAAHRPLTDNEQAALAYHAAKNFSINSWAPTLSIGAGVYRTYATRTSFRWPFYGRLISNAPLAEGEVPKGFWDGEKMRVGGKEILQGVSSQAKANMLHVSRGFAYCVISLFLGGLAVGTYAATVSGVGQLRDPRLQDLNRRIKEATAREQRQEMGKVVEVVKQTEARREGRMPNSPRGTDQGRGRRGGATEVDDASPTGGAGIMMDMGIDDEQERLSGAADMGGVLSDGQMRTAEAKARPRPNQSPISNRAPTYQMESQPKDFTSDFDDASPTGGTGAMDGGSVWERIRQQSASDPSSSYPKTTSTGSSRRGTTRGGGMQQQGQQEGSGDNSFSFSSSDEERSFAKSEAQREFDERVEKERRGGEISSRGGGRRW